MTLRPRKDEWVQIRVDRRTKIRLAAAARAACKTISKMLLDDFEARFRFERAVEERAVEERDLG